MDAVLLARLMFAMTVGFHFIFPSITLGLAWLLVILEWRGWRRNDPDYVWAGRFFGRLFAVTFVMGVATGITMEFQFGTNWAEYSKFVGHIFGAPVWREEPLAWKTTYKLHMITPVVIALVAANLVRLLKKQSFTGAFFHSCVMVLCVMAFIFISLYPRLLPSSVALANSLTVNNASSSHLTLKVMLAIALIGMPLVIAYQAFIYRVFKGRVEITEDSY